MTTLQPTSVTYGDIVAGNVIIDKSENEWIALEPTTADGITSLSLATKENPGIKVHSLSKPAGDPVTILTVPPFDQAARDAEIAKREAEMDAAQQKYGNMPPPPAPPVAPTTEEAAKTVVDTLGGEVASFETARHEHARKAAEETGVPMDLPLWEEMTEPEKLSHLYLVHGVWGYDVIKLGELTELHENAHKADVELAAHRHIEGLR